MLICAWAEKGADALGPDGVVVHSDAFPPEALVDTLGAGDTFNASVIYTLSNGMEKQHQITVHFTVMFVIDCPIRKEHISLKAKSIILVNYGSDSRLLSSYP